MTRKRVRWYMISVLAYYRSEWTAVADSDNKFRLVLTPDLEELLLGCFKRKTSVPNAAKEVEIFLSLKPDACGLCDYPIPTDEDRRIKDGEAESEGSSGQDPTEAV